jgi:thiol-disulfide isomerase/thioredoxin
MTTLIHYVGASWCAPCRTVKPRVEDLCKKYGIHLIVHNYDELPEEESSNVGKLPTIRISHNSQIVAEYTTNHIQQLEEWCLTHVRVIPTDDF